MSLEREFYQRLENLKRQLLTQPLTLGGISGGTGQQGGRPAGFIGQLPQSRVVFDEDELAVWEIPPSGMPLPSGQSLVTNLNRIRYRLDLLENAIVPSGSPQFFIGLLDTPNDYTGQQGKVVVVNDTEDGLVFEEVTLSGVALTTFLELTDAPDTYSGQGDRVVYVKSDETGLEFRSIVIPSGVPTAFTDLTDTPESYTGAGGEMVVVRGDETGLEFVPIPSGTGGLSNLPVSEGGSPIVNATSIDFTGNVEVSDAGGGQALIHIPTPSGVGPVSFLDLTDTPSSYTGEAGKMIVVGGTETGVEFVEVPSGVGGLSYINVAREETPGSPVQADTILVRRPLTVFNPDTGVARIQLYQTFLENGEAISAGTPPSYIDFVGPFDLEEGEFVGEKVLTVSLPGFEETPKHIYNEVPVEGSIGGGNRIVGFDNTSFVELQGDNPIEFNHTTGEFPSRLLVYACGIRDGQEITGVTYNNVSLTKLTHAVEAGDMRVELWYLLSPSVGTHQVVANSTNNDQVKFSSVSTFYNVDQDSPLGTPATNIGESDTSTVNLGASLLDLIIDVYAIRDGKTVDAGSEQTGLYEIDSGPNLSGGVSYSEPSTDPPTGWGDSWGEMPWGGGTTTPMTWDSSGSDAFAHMGVVIKGFIEPSTNVLLLSRQYILETLRVYQDGLRVPPTDYVEIPFADYFIPSYEYDLNTLYVDFDYLDNPIIPSGIGYGLTPYGEYHYGF